MTLRTPPEEGAPTGRTGLTLTCNRFFPHKGIPKDLADCLVTRPRDFRLVIWELLPTKAPAPPKAYPFCCYIQSVIFYHYPFIVSPFGGYWRDDRGNLRAPQTRGYVEWDHVRSRLAWDDVVEFEGERFSVGGGRVLWKRGRWWILHHARRLAP